MCDEHSKTGNPAVGSTRLLADAYRQAAELYTALDQAKWSRSMPRRDLIQVGKLILRASELMNTIYHVTQANK